MTVDPDVRENPGNRSARGTSLSVVIPAFNEEDAIVETIDSVKKVLSEMDCRETEIVIVDDGSTDRTADLAIECGVRVLRKPHNIGYGHSLKLGIEAARYDTIAITDADGTYPVHEIPRLLDLYRQGFNMVVGERTGEHFRESWLKAPLRHILRLIVEFTAGRRIPDPNSGLRVFSRKEIMPFFPFLSNAFSFTISSTLAYMLNYYYVTYVQIPYYKRVGTTKVRMFQDSLRVIQYIVAAILYYNPIKMFLILSMFLGLAGIPVVAAGVLSGSAWLIASGLVILGMIIPSFIAGLVVEANRQYLLHPPETKDPVPVSRHMPDGS